ncbi:MAG TPA: F0F1 ATP synthase subunit A [Blastocatellia bacterium]|nr:F0F1 ATP synthase subunit A [Blastocatellia bacterium]
MLNYLPALALVEEGASKAASAAAPGSGEPWLTVEFNHLFGSATLAVERLILPGIYGLFGAHWQEPPPGELIIPTHVVMAIIGFAICIILALVMRGRLSVDRPSKGQQMLEVIVEMLRDLLGQVIGPYGRRYVPFIGALTVFILIGNLTGLIPGLEAPTMNINVTAALGISSFLYYMSMGFRQQKVGYLKHFTGGLTGAWLPMGIMIFFIELMSNCVRPVTLSVRLFVNIFADHQIATTFLGLAPWLVPLFTLVLGVFVSLVQTFIFVMLSMVYLSETVPHEEHDTEHHGHAEAAAA